MPENRLSRARRVLKWIARVVGVLLSALMTLYIVPAFYKVFARGTRSRNAVAEELSELQTQEA